MSANSTATVEYAETKTMKELIKRHIYGELCIFSGTGWNGDIGLAKSPNEFGRNHRMRYVNSPNAICQFTEREYVNSPNEIMSIHRMALTPVGRMCYNKRHEKR